MVSSQATHSERIDAIVLPAIGKDAPGCAVGVFVEERVAFSKGYGLANLVTRQKVTGSTVFDSASLSKQFTALAVEQLRRRGLLAFDDEVRQHLPGFKPNATIRQLLQHTSGLPDAFSIAERKGVSRDELTMAQAVELLMELDASASSPGVQFRYSNSGYILLGAVVERLSGQSFSRYLQKEVFEPLGMLNSRIAGHPPETFDASRAAGYYRDPDSVGRFANYAAPPVVYGSGGVLTTLEDLFSWHRALYAETAGTGRRLIDLLSDRTATPRGPSVPYGLGLRVSTYRGSPLVHHGGGNRGFHHHFASFPDHRFSAVVLCNAGDLKPWEWTLEIADIFLGDQLAPKPLNGRREGWMLKDVVEVRHLGGHRLRIRFEDGVTGELDRASPSSSLLSAHSARR
jgi:CubicO group peptidase (beta-lactamase class C family)